MTSRLEGGCPCGAVRFRTRGDPQDWVRCDCGFCRGLARVRGPGDPVWPDACVEFGGGKIGSVGHTSEAHPRPMTVHFCIACGTAVSLSLDGRRTERALLLSTFDEPARVSEAMPERREDGRRSMH
ncbi:MAG: hypothetical protein RJA99_326 [Pseudomonadota bacterium]|jgi:hypothetical protein